MLINIGTLASTVAYPDEQIGYLASEQYASRSNLNSPGPQGLYKLHSNASQPAIESPLRKTSFPADDIGHAEFNKSRDSISGRSEDAMESEQDEDRIHIDPKNHYNKITGGQETIRETEDVQPYVSHPTEEGGLVDEHGYSVPILAADEVAREVGHEDMQPAVPPSRERRGSAYDEYYGSGDVTPSSRPASRPGSIHGGMLSNQLSRFTSRHEEYREDMHTPLEDVDEYEPLFPDDDSKQKAMTAAERFKRPQTLQHRFPSQDIWEDTPSSAMHMAEVSTPDLPAGAEKSNEPVASKTFESPEAEAARKEEPSEEEKKKLIPKEERLAKSQFAPHLRDDMPTRPGMQPRFPSQDVWEDTPDSHYQYTTVSSQQEEEIKSPTEASSSKPSIPPRPNKSRPGEGASSAQKEPSVQPSIPTRPQKRVYAVPPVNAKLTDPATLSGQKDEETSPRELRKVPSIPDRPKPQVPVRPAKQTSTESLSKTISATSAGSSGSTETEKGVPVTSPPAVKAKPQIPARPGQGSKIANLKGNFMNDLNQRLQLGPPKEKEKEPEPEAEKEAKPLEDARKGRARGPQRRAPAKSPSGSAESAATSTEKKMKFSLSSPTTIWHIDSVDGALKVHSHNQASSTSAEALPAATEQAVEAAAQEAPVDISGNKLAQMEHSTLSAPVNAAAEGTKDEGTSGSRTASLDVPSSMAPAGLSTNTAGEPTDPSSLGPSPVHRHEEEIDDPMNKLKEQDFEPSSISKQTTASTGISSGTALARVQAEDHEQGSSLSQHTTADSEASGATLEKQETPDRTEKDRKVAGGAVEQPKATMPLPGTDEEKLSGAGTSMPGAFGEPEPEAMETDEGSRQVGARDTSQA